MIDRDAIKENPRLRTAAKIHSLLFCAEGRPVDNFSDEIVRAKRVVNDEATDVNLLFGWRHTTQGRDFWHTLHNLSCVCAGEPEGAFDQAKYEV